MCGCVSITLLCDRNFLPLLSFMVSLHNRSIWASPEAVCSQKRLLLMPLFLFFALQMSLQPRLADHPDTISVAYAEPDIKLTRALALWDFDPPPSCCDQSPFSKITCGPLKKKTWFKQGFADRCLCSHVSPCTHTSCLHSHILACAHTPACAHTHLPTLTHASLHTHMPACCVSGLFHEVGHVRLKQTTNLRIAIKDSCVFNFPLNYFRDDS